MRHLRGAKRQRLHGNSTQGDGKDADWLYPAQGDKGQSDRRIICGYSEKKWETTLIKIVFIKKCLFW